MEHGKRNSKFDRAEDSDEAHQEIEFYDDWNCRVVNTGSKQMKSLSQALRGKNRRSI
jgi:hypothetical protein